jgi:hypothetical protein
VWIKTYSKTFQGLKREDVWRIWTDVNRWPTWHGDLDYCSLDGDFKVGHHFFLKPKGVKPVKIMLTEIKEGYSFTDCTSFFGAKMYDTHEMIDTSDGLTLSNRLIVTGPLKWFWIKLVAQNVADTMEEQTENLVKVVRGLYV